MEENTYQKLGARTLLYGMVAGSLIPLVILLLTLGLVLLKNYLGSSPVASGFDSFLDLLIYLGSWVTFIALVITLSVAWLKYITFQFLLGSNIFKIKRGIFTKTEIAIPYRRIESVDIRRTLIHQLFGVSRITIETTIDSAATADNKSNASDEVFPIIDHQLAQTIQEELTKRANVQKMQA